MKKLKVLDTCWHLAHSWELLKNPEIDWYYLMNNYRRWEWTIRGSDFPATWVPYIEPGLYDFAVLHLDQSCINPRLGKSKLFREMKVATEGIPRVVIMHGTPMLEGYTEEFVLNGGESKIANSEEFEKFQGIKELVGEIPMIVNSYQAKKRWGWGDVIWHGLSPDEWWDLPKEPRIITTVSPAGMSDDYYGRRFLESVRSILREEYGIRHQWVIVDYVPEQDCGRKHHNAFDAYRDFIGRSLIYFNPTGDSPMPRARTEAMLSGCCVVSTAQHDVERFIESGQNGFIVPKDAYAAAKLLADLIYKYPKQAQEIGQKGKATAKETFHIDRFSKDWIAMIEKVKGGYSGKDQERTEPELFKGVQRWVNARWLKRNGTKL